jgi:hypothetical protein
LTVRADLNVLDALDNWDLTVDRLTDGVDPLTGTSTARYFSDVHTILSEDLSGTHSIAGRDIQIIDGSLGDG